jgi:YVTN family beta-propeller protein
VAATPDGSKVYVANEHSNTVSVIATATNTVTATIAVGDVPIGVAVAPDSSKVYVTNFGSNTVSVIDTRSAVGGMVGVALGRVHGFSTLPDRRN